MKFRVLAASLLLAASCQLMAQNTGSVGGTVTDESGEPIIGAQVTVKGSNAMTVTDADGHFHLKGVKNGQEVVINYLGMETQTVKAGQNMKVSMRSQDRQLDEVIVVAYGEQKRSSFTGSAGVVGDDKIANRQVTNVMDALDGQVAGVQMIKTSGDPTATPTIHVRGISSISAGQEPLIVVDGAPYYGAWSDINPADVASMTVLKDAASNALYGARGANGVILITTKRPQQGRSVITLDAKWGSNSRASETYDVVNNPGQYYEMFYRALYNYNVNSLGLSAAQAHVQTNEQMVNTVANGGLGYVCYTYPQNEYLIGTNGKLNPHATLGRIYTGSDGKQYTVMPDDWVKEAYRNTLRQEYNANINGGNDVAQFYASLGYLNDPGIAYGSAYERYTARLKATYKANEWLKVGGNVNYVHSTTDYASTSSGTSTFYVVNRIAPIYPVYVRDGQGNIMTDANGRMYDYGAGNIADLTRPVLSSQNPLKDDQLQTKESISNSIYLNGFVDITPTWVKNLKITVNGTVSDYEYRYTDTEQPFYGWGLMNHPTGSVSKYHYRYYTVNFQQLANYTRSFGKHNMTLLLGHENYRQTDENVGASRENMFSFYTNNELSGAVKELSSSSSQTKYNTEGYFFRGMYDYDGIYFGQLSYRRDASSRFHPDHRWGDFYSLGGAWIMTKEAWMASTKSWLDELKVKASFGQQGNDEIGNYMYMDTYSIDNSNGELGLTLSNVGNPNITWETNTNVNVGVEFQMLKNRLRGSIEYFYRKTTDMLSFVSVPLSLGYAGSYSNVGDMTNKGIELDLTFDAVRSKDLVWSVNLNATHYKNEITYLYEDNKTNTLDGHPGYVNTTQFYGEGLPIYTWRLKKYAGVDENGLSTWYKTEGDGTLSRTTDWSAADYYACGAPHPDLYGGFGTSLSYKGFDFTVNFAYSIGGKVYDSNYQTLMASPSTGTLGQGFHKDLLNAWSTENASSNIPRWQYNDTYANATSDRFLTNGSYLSLQNINLGYTVPTKWATAIGLTKIKVYAAADNVYLWTKRKGLDPRTSFTGNPATEQYSFVRTISGGVTLQF